MSRQALENFYATLPQGAGNDEKELPLIADRIDQIGIDVEDDKPWSDDLYQAAELLRSASSKMKRFDLGEWIADRDAGLIETHRGI